MSKTKPFDISQEKVKEAYKRVKANKGAAGVDKQTIEDFEKNVENNLYKIWNRMSSGTYFPSAVRSVEIPKKDGKGVRRLGVPTVADRVAQMVVKLYLEPLVEPMFHRDSYGYRPNKSAHGALDMARERCWENAWILELDIRAFFDNLDHNLVVEMVKKHTDSKWILLYIERWLKAPIQMEDGTLVERKNGSPQGSVISPLLSNIFLHYAFDSWMESQFPYVPFERYADDAIAHCRTEKQAKYLKYAIIKRLAEYKLELNEEKTRIVYCKDTRRTGKYKHERFDFLGYTFRPRLTKKEGGGRFVSFSPAISDKAGKEIRQKIRGWKMHLRSDTSLSELARRINPEVQGWINYYGRYGRTELYSTLRQLNEYLIRWARRKYKKMKSSPLKAKNWLGRIAIRQPGLFAHWRFGFAPTAG